MQGLFNNGWGQVIVILLGILVGVLFNNVRLTDLRSHVDKRIDDLGKRLDDVDKSLRDFIHSEIKRLEDRLARLEYPIFKP